MMDWLLNLDPKVAELFKLTSSTMLTVAGLVVSVVALNFSYRNSRGWKPLLIIKSRLYTELHEPALSVFVDFEVWNRRKYPIIIRKLRVMGGDLKFIDVMKTKDGEAKLGWFVTMAGTRVLKFEDTAVQPAAVRHADTRYGKSVRPALFRRPLSKSPRLLCWERC